MKNHLWESLCVLLEVDSSSMVGSTQQISNIQFRLLRDMVKFCSKFDCRRMIYIYTYVWYLIFNKYICTSTWRYFSHHFQRNSFEWILAPNHLPGISSFGTTSRVAVSRSCDWLPAGFSGFSWDWLNESQTFDVDSIISNYNTKMNKRQSWYVRVIILFPYSFHIPFLIIRYILSEFQKPRNSKLNSSHFRQQSSRERVVIVSFLFFWGFCQNPNIGSSLSTFLGMPGLILPAFQEWLVG